MKSLYLVILFLAMTSFTQNNLLAQNIGSKATFHGNMNLKRIPTNVGKQYIILQDCDTSLAPKLAASQFIFLHATMGKIKDAHMIYDMQNDTIQAITIYFKNEHERAMAIKQAKKQFGPGKFSQNNMMKVYYWMPDNNGNPISVSLAFNDGDSPSEMFIKKTPVN